ncbi:DUF5691 domain-containing protein, partial [Sinomonas sp. G460-2]|uniref:DUF5691 domain-containing protein n=1 Tax=Sinomonas sp. G460-2 TaxID=3393464 RepID=UPI0039EE580F
MSWLTELRTTALVGTARHPAPAAPQDLGAQPPEGRSSEESLLDQAAMADVIVRATRRAGHLAPGKVRDPAPPDDVPPASGDAARLLDLLLTQSPVGRELQLRLVTDWLVLAERAELRVPHGLLPALLTLAGGAPSVAEHLEPAIGTRGRWLQGLISGRAGDQRSPADAEWAELGGADASAQLERLRQRDPASARELLTAAWEGLGARERAAHLAVFATNLGPADEDLLETALDDKAKGVREAATTLLDRLPQSARAARMAARLRRLLRVKGLLRK